MRAEVTFSRYIATMIVQRIAAHGVRRSTMCLLLAGAEVDECACVSRCAPYARLRHGRAGSTCENWVWHTWKKCIGTQSVHACARHMSHAWCAAAAADRGWRPRRCRRPSMAASHVVRAPRAARAVLNVGERRHCSALQRSDVIRCTVLCCAVHCYAMLCYAML